MVSVTPRGFATPWPPAAVPDTVTCLLSSGITLSDAVILTAPMLAVDPAATVSVVPHSVKSPATAGATAVADTVIVVASLDLPESVAVTTDAPPFSEINDGDSTSVATGRVSSSASVSVRFDGAATAPCPPEAAAETVTVRFLSGAYTSSSLAEIVTVPVLAVVPAAMVSVAAVLSAKSPATASAAGAAETVRITASLDVPESVAVTVASPPFSEIEFADSASAAVGAASSSFTVTATVTSARSL